MSPRNQAWDDGLDPATVARIAAAGEQKLAWRRAHDAKQAAKQARIKAAAEQKAAWQRRHEESKWGDLDDTAIAAIADEAVDDAAVAAIANAAVAEAKEQKECWDDVNIDEDTAAIIAAAEERRNMSSAVKMAIASDPSRSPPTRRGGFQDHPPTPKPLPQTPQPTIITPPATSRAFRSSALTLADAKAIGPWTTWTLFPDAEVQLTVRSLPLEELSPPPLPSTPFSKALGKRKMPPSK